MNDSEGVSSTMTKVEIVKDIYLHICKYENILTFEVKNVLTFWWGKDFSNFQIDIFYYFDFCHCRRNGFRKVGRWINGKAE